MLTTAKPEMSSTAHGIIHIYADRRIAFEFTPSGNKNVLVFVGGLMDGLLTVPYLVPLAEELGKIGYSLIQIQISSSHTGWGVGSLSRDSDEIAMLINYLKSEKGGSRVKVGLMGHSTGCQNTTHYFTRQPREDPAKFSTIDFGILQAPVSDRISGSESLPSEDFTESVKLAEKLIAAGEETELMPSKYTKYFFNVPITAYRWNSLMGVRGDDDFFSDDLDESDFETTFGKFDKPFLVLYSGADEYVPARVDKGSLMSKWAKAAGNYWSPHSKIVNGATHNIGPGSSETAEKEALDSIIAFINSYSL